MTPKLYSRTEAAKMLGISDDTLDALRRERQISYIQRKKNGRVWFTEDAINEYLARTTHRAQPVREVRETYRKRRA